MSELEKDLISLAIDITPQKPDEPLNEWIRRIVEELPPWNPWKEKPRDRTSTKQ